MLYSGRGHFKVLQATGTFYNREKTDPVQPALIQPEYNQTLKIIWLLSYIY